MDYRDARTRHPHPWLGLRRGRPKIGSTTILSKSRSGFDPPSHEQLDDMLRGHVEGSFDSKHTHERLAAIAKMLSVGDVALAAIATSQLRLRKTSAPGRDELGLSLREQLAGASFAERRAAGLAVLRRVGILRP